MPLWQVVQSLTPTTKGAWAAGAPPVGGTAVWQVQPLAASAGAAPIARAVARQKSTVRTILRLMVPPLVLQMHAPGRSIRNPPSLAPRPHDSRWAALTGGSPAGSGGRCCASGGSEPAVHGCAPVRSLRILGDYPFRGEATPLGDRHLCEGATVGWSTEGGTCRSESGSGHSSPHSLLLTAVFGTCCATAAAEDDAWDAAGMSWGFGGIYVEGRRRVPHLLRLVRASQHPQGPER